MVLWTQWQWESPPSFCNGLNHIYNILSRKELFDITIKDIGSKFRYGLGKVLSTQNHPILRLASSHCVLCLNPIKGTLNIAF